MSKIENLKQQLDYHDDLYYNQDDPELSDVEYDALKQEYLNLVNQQEYNYIPGQAQFKKFTHTFPIKSLGKINTIEQLNVLLKQLGMDKLAANKVNNIKAPMPGLVLRISVAIGDVIKKGDPLLVLEAMKMENVIKAAGDGVVKKINAIERTAVEKGSILIEFE